MRTPQELNRLREQAVQLRRQGKSRRQIKLILGPMSNATLNDALSGEPPPEWTRRPNAKDHLRSRACDLRAQGLDYEEIATALGVAKSSVSHGSDRELLIAGAIAYWCEGAKSKPHQRSDRVVFINSDPALIRFFLRFLDAAGTPVTDLGFRVYIHENADVESAQQFWLKVTGVPADQFATPTLKRHNPKTVRRNQGETYHGCLRIDVHHSANLYRKIEGWATASMADGVTQATC